MPQVSRNEKHTELIATLGKVVTGFIPALQTLDGATLEETIQLKAVKDVVKVKLLASEFSVSMVIFDILLRLAHLFIFSAVVSSRKALKVRHTSVEKSSINVLRSARIGWSFGDNARGSNMSQYTLCHCRVT